MCGTQRQLSLCGTQRQLSLCITNRKLPKIMKSGMKQVQVPPFDPKLRQDEATASRSPPECPPPFKIAQKSKNQRRKENPPFPSSPCPILGCCAVGSTSGALCICLLRYPALETPATTERLGLGPWALESGPWALVHWPQGPPSSLA